MNDLVTILMKQLGLGEGQARGVLGLVFRLLKGKLSAADFAGFADLVPEVEDLIAASPKSGGLGGMLGGLAGGKVGVLAELTSGLKALDLDVEQGKRIVEELRSFLLANGKGDLVDRVENLMRS